LIELPRSLADALVRHAREAAPDEACGFAVVRGERVLRLERTRNASPTPRVHFTFDGAGYQRMVEVEKECEQAGGRVVDIGIYHSHPASAAYPSPTDREDMRQTWPDCLQLMVSLRHDATSGPEINAYRIDREGEVSVEDLRIVEG
jgi:[CysO sulfur-carrier protein]-S-L-cysteine hydrolase